MKNIFRIILLLTITSYISAQSIKYPATKKIDHTDNYHGTIVPDPFRWLEDPNSDETKKWVEEQNNITFEYLEKIPFREKIKNRLTELWNYERYSAPSKIGDYYVYSKNDGLQEQSVLYIQKGLNGQPEVFLDPNKFSNDGSVSLAGLSFSKDYKFASYMISKGGSDWREIYVMDVASKKLLPDYIKWSKFGGMTWYKNGFYYNRYDEPLPGEELKQSNEYQKLFYHKLGTEQKEDILIWEDKENPKRLFGAMVTEDEKFLVINVLQGSSSFNGVMYKDLQSNSKIKWLFDKFDSRYSVIDNIDNNFLVLTNYDAPNGKLILVDPSKPEKENWKTVITETKDVIQGISILDDKLFVTYLKDANNKVSVFDITGKHLNDVELPTLGTVSGFGGERKDSETFYTFTSFTYPPTIFKYDIRNNKSEIFRKSNVKFDMSDYETKQIFYESLDGTKIPLFIVHKKGLKLDGSNPALLYAYGGFNISMQPGFSVARIPLLENNVVYAMACLRGGSEYGED